MPDKNDYLIPTMGIQGLINDKTKSVSSIESNGIPVLGLDPVIETDKRVDEGIPVVPVENKVDNIQPYGWDNIGEMTKDSYAISPFGMFYRKTQEGTGDFWNRYTPTHKEWSEIYEAVGADEDVLDVVLNGTNNMDDVKKNIALYKENKYIEKRLAASPWYWQLYGGVVGALGNPVDIATMAASFFFPPAAGVGRLASLATAKAAQTAIGIGERVGVNVATGVAANQVASEINGLETDAWRDVLAITTLSGAFEALGYASGKIRASRLKSAAMHDKIINGEVPESLEQVAPNLAQVANSKGFIAKANDLREQLVSGLPSVDVKHRVNEFRKDNIQSVNDLMGSMFHLEEGFRGVRSASGVMQQYANRRRESLELDTIPFDRKNAEGTTRWGSGNSTFFEEVKKLDVDNQRYIMGIPNSSSAVRKKYGDEYFTEYTFLKAEGYDIPAYLADMDSDPLVKKFIKPYMDFYKKRGAQLAEADAIDNVWSFSNYVPVNIDHAKIVAFNKASGSVKRGRAKITQNLFDGVHADPKRTAMFRQIFDEERAEELAKQKEKAVANGIEWKEPELSKEDLDAEFNSWVWGKAEEAAMGYSDQNLSRTKRPDNFSDFSVGFSFTRRRMPWNFAYRDRNGWSMNDLRADPIDTIQRYANRSRGLIASKRVYGTDYDGFINKLNEAGNKLMEKHFGDETVKASFVRDMEALYKRGFGMSITNQDAYSIGDAFGIAMRNGMFSTVGTYMGALNLGEIGTLTTSYGATSLIRSLPVAGQVVDMFAKSGKLTPEAIKQTKDLLVGREFLDRTGFRETLRQSQRRLEGVNPYLAKAVGVTDYVTQYSPAALVFRGIQNRINDVITDCVTSEIIERAMNPTSKAIKGLFKDPKVYERLGISNNDLKYLNRVVKKITQKNADGSYSYKDTIRDIVDDDKFRDIFGRMHNYAWEECLQRRNLDDIFTWQLNNKNFLFELAMQFKSFAIQSYNKRFVKMSNRLEEGDNLGVFNYVMATTALSGLVNMCVSYTRSAGMEEEARNDYLDRTIGFHNFKDLDNPEVLAQALFYNTVNRNPLLASYALAWNTLGIGTGGKTTADILSAEEYNESIPWFNLGKTATDMIPSARILQSSVNFGIGTANYAMENEDLSTVADRRLIQKQLLQGLNLLPQLPYLTPILRDHVKDGLEEYKYGY